MSKQEEDVKSNRGIALIVALLTLLVLSTLGTSLLFITETEVRTSYNFKLLTQARYAAEAGTQSTLNWLIYSYTRPTDYSGFNMNVSPVTYMGSPVVLSAMTGQTANYPDSAVQTAFDSALREKSVPGADVPLTYSVTATLQSMRLITPIGSASQQPLLSWLIRSQGSVGGSQAQVEVTTTIERLGNAAFSYAAFGSSDACGAVSFKNGAQTDSYNSNAGTYSATHQDLNGDIGTNGNISIDSMAFVHGNGSSPFSTSGDCSSGSKTGMSGDGFLGFNIAGMLTGPSVTVPTPAAPSSDPPTTTQQTTGDCGSPSISGCSVLSGTKNLAFATGNYGNLTIDNGTTVHLSAGVYNINSLTITGGSRVVIDSGPVIFNIAGKDITDGTTPVFTLNGGSEIYNAAGHPSNAQIVYAKSQPISLAGGASTYGVVYAPKAPLTISGGAAWYGSLIANTITNGTDLSGGTFIHYDRALAANLISMGDYHITSFSWSKY